MCVFRLYPSSLIFISLLSSCHVQRLYVEHSFHSFICFRDVLLFWHIDPLLGSGPPRTAVECCSLNDRLSNNGTATGKWLFPW
jgi:hypothetical protein